MRAVILFSNMSKQFYWQPLVVLLMIVAMLGSTGAFGQEKKPQPKDSNSPADFITRLGEAVFTNLEEWKQLELDDHDAFVDTLLEWSEPWFDRTRIAAGVMGRNYYIKATKEQREQFKTVLFESLLNTYAQGIFFANPDSLKLLDHSVGKNPKTAMVRQQAQAGSREAIIEYSLYRSKPQKDWKIVNVTVEGINLRRIFNQTFTRSAQRFNHDLDKVIVNWSSDIGDAIKENKVDEGVDGGDTGEKADENERDQVKEDHQDKAEEKSSE